MNDIILLFLLLSTKHFIVDFPLQTPYQYLNKGNYGHPGGILHSALHGLTTTACFWWFDLEMALVYGYVDFILHYHIDWAKMRLNSHFQLKPDSSEKFWWLLGLDQYLHYLTYVTLIGLAYSRGVI